MSHNFIDLTGRIFGRLTVLERVPANGQARWRCKCSCSAIRVVRGQDLRSGKSTSCGCYGAEARAAAATRHGHARREQVSVEYETWCSMIVRCTIGAKSAENYAHRGIAVCERWRTFENFLADMGTRPPGTSIDRIDNDKGYEPGNCRWATRQQQSENRRSTQWIEVDGDRATLAEWCRRTGLSAAGIKDRLRRGWSPRDAVMTPAGASPSAAVSQ